MQAEIAVRGAGPVGCVLALLLRQSGKNVVLEGKRALAADSPLRPIALSHASRLILERCGAWESLQPTPILSIHVSQQGGFGRARLEAADAGVPALGYVLDYDALLSSLTDQVEKAGIPVQPDAGEAALTVHAEGASSEASERDYGQEALVAVVTTRPAATATAWERFTPEGPLALLPCAGRYLLVWGMRPERAQELCASSRDRFLEALAAAFGTRAGGFVDVGKRSRAPLALRVLASRIGDRQAYVGNAAQTLHPVAGQGLNLGLRDAWDLAQLLRDAPDPGAAPVLARFAALRRCDAAATLRATDFLARGFLGNGAAAGALRGIGLTMLDICLPARRFFARRMIYGASALP